MPLNFVWAPLIIEVFFCFSHLPPSVGCNLSLGYFSQEKHIRLKRGLQRIFKEKHVISLVKGLSKMVFSHFKRMRLGSVCLAFFHANMQNGFSLSMQLKLNF